MAYHSGSYQKGLLEGVHRLHFIGIGGSGMFPLVQILATKGYTITGSDVNEGSIIESERNMGIQVFMGHKAENVLGADLVVYSAAIHDDNPEMQAAQAHGIRCVERSVMLGYVSRLYQNSICVSGTHGKTTTTSMITTRLELAGRDPAAVIGGKLPLIHGYGKAGTGREIVVEACEFSETFLQLTPAISIILNIDNDHLDYYGTLGKLKFAFRRFALLTQHTVIANLDDANTRDVVGGVDRPVRTFAVNNPEADYTAVNIKMAIRGRHHITPALAMCCCVRILNPTPEDAAVAAEHFTGAARRFQILGEVNGATVVDDYAHHPTEVRATLETAKSLGYNQVWAVHQPFTYSRTKALMDDFVSALEIADHVVITPIMGSREVDDGSVKSEDLAARIPGSVVVGGLQEAADYIKAHAQKGDLVITLGCGDVYKAANMMLT